MSENIETLYESVGEFRNRRSACEIFSSKCPELAEATPEEVADRLAEKYDEKNTIYFGANYRKADSAMGAEFLWIPTGFNNKNGELLYFQFTKGTYQWAGAYGGTPSEIVKHQMESVSKVKAKREMQNNLSLFMSTHKATTTVQKKAVVMNTPASKTSSSSVTHSEGLTPWSIVKPVSVDRDAKEASVTVSVPVKAPIVAEADDLDTTNIDPDEEKFYKEFYAKLLVKVGWSPSLIKNYLYTMINRENYLLFNNRGEEFIIRSTTSINGKKYGMMNTALLNTLGNPIRLIVQFWGTNPETPLGYCCKFWSICDSKITALQSGFSKDDMNKEIRPVVFYDSDPSELVFSADIDEFDLENETRLEHCIDRKAERGGLLSAGMSDNQAYSSIVQAIRTAVAISKYDSSYVKPIYNRKANKINFAIPFHLSGRFDAAPELGIIVSKGSFGLWQIMTVLEYETVRYDHSCLVPYRSSSF